MKGGFCCQVFVEPQKGEKMIENEFNISNAELVIMRVIWSLGEARVDEIARQVSPELDWSLATVKTLLGRLVKKEMLSTEKEGRKFIYRPLIAECAAISLMGKTLLDKVCQTKQSQLLEDMIGMSVLTAADARHLIEILEKRQTVESVSCTCLEDIGVCSCQHEHEQVAVKMV